MENNDNKVVKIYFDMDNTLLNLHKTVRTMAIRHAYTLNIDAEEVKNTPIDSIGYDYRELNLDKKQVQSLLHYDGVFDSLEPMTYLDVFKYYVAYAKLYSDVEVYICSQLTYSDSCLMGKINQLKKYAPDFDCENNTIFMHKKHLLADKCSILIDDKPSNITQWVQCGGFGVMIDWTYNQSFKFIRRATNNDQLTQHIEELRNNIYNNK